MGQIGSLTRADKLATEATLVQIQAILGGAFNPPASTDAITVTYPDAVTEVYSFRTGGVGGAVVMTITITYTDSTKANLLSVTRT